MAQELARLIMEPDFPDAAEMFPVEEDADGMREQHQEILKDLRKRFGSHVVAQVTKLHQQYNHPSCERLAKELSDARMDPVLVACAREYICEICLGRLRPGAVRIVAIMVARYFNEILEIDIFVIQYHGKKKKVLAMLDEFSRFGVDAVSKNEKAETECRLLEKYWIRWAGPPKILRLDPSGAHMSQFMKEWCERHGIKMMLVAKGAHHSLAFVERRHQSPSGADRNLQEGPPLGLPEEDVALDRRRSEPPEHGPRIRPGAACAR
jgi:Integrase core domain.